MSTTTNRHPQKRSRILLSALLCAGSVLATSAAWAEVVEFRGRKLDIATPGETIPNQIVVVAETRESKLAMGGLATKMGGSVIRDIPTVGMQAWRVANDATAKQMIAEINKMKGFHAYANPKMSITPPPEVLPQLKEILVKKAAAKAGTTPKSFDTNGLRKPKGSAGDVTKQWATNDVSVSAQWALSRIGEPLAAAPAAGTKGIAIIDTGVDYTHPDLAGKVVSVWDYVDNDADAMDADGHGTHCAGIAAAKANNTAGIRGVSPNSTIYAYRVLDETGSGSYADINAAIIAAANNPNVHVLSLSLGGYALEGSTEYNDMRNALNYAVLTKGKILVAAAGNEYNDLMYYYQWYGYSYRAIPAWYPNSFTVAATGETDSRAWFSNYNVNVSSPDATTVYNFNFVDIAAPGDNILSTTMGDGYEKWSGTSMATPLVAGAAARLWDANPGYTATQVRNQLYNTGQNLCSTSGFPVCTKRLDLYRALGGTYTGGFIGRVINGESGLPVDGVTVEAVAGGVTKATTTTTRAGYYVLPSLPSTAAGYIIRISKTGWVTRGSPNYGNRPAGALTSLMDQPIVPSRPSTASDENWRIIVSWAHTQPGYDIFYIGWYYDGYYDYFPYSYWHTAGLESNAYLRRPGGSSLYWGSRGSLTATPYAKYMHDSYDDNVPLESFVIRDKEAGSYKLYLAMDPWDLTWGSIRYGAAGAVPNYPVVDVYKGNAFQKRVNGIVAVQESGGTMYWDVLDLTDNADPVTVINKVTDTAP